MITSNFQEATDKLCEHLEDYLQEKGINTTGLFRCIHPNHEDRTPSCSLLPHKRIFHCHGCKVSGNIFHAIHFLDKKPITGPEFIEETLIPLAEKYKIPLQLAQLTEEQIYEYDAYKAYKSATDLIVNGEPSEIFLNVLEEKGWTSEICKELGVGCVADYKVFRERLKSLGFGASFLDDIDLSRQDIFNPNSLIYSIKDQFGRTVGFASRNLVYDGNKKNGSKYVNQRGTGLKCNIYKKNTRLFGIDRVIQKYKKKIKQLYLFEGYGDVVTAAQQGMDNAVAIGGCNLSSEQVYLIKSLKCYDIILCLDSDEAGQRATIDILDNVLGQHKDLKVSVLVVPDKKDPEEFIKEHGIHRFRRLRKWDAFEWRLLQFDEEENPETICKSTIPLIVNETSYIRQEEMAKILARTTGYTLKTIQQEINRMQNQHEAEKSREREVVITQLVQTIQKDPANAEFAIGEAESKLFDLAKQYNIDVFSEETFLSILKTQKTTEEAKDGSFAGYILGEDFRDVQEALSGDWKNNWILVGGKANVGKTAFVNALAVAIASHEENNALAIIHSIDDSAEQVIPRLVCICEGTRQLEQNEVVNPNYYSTLNGKQDVMERRENGYQKLFDLVSRGRLVVKDANAGFSLTFADRLVRYYREKYPDRNIVYILDNFHKLRGNTNAKDERVKFREFSTVLKDIATKYHITVISTVEYRKTDKKATNSDISESIQMEYDGNAIIHVHSDLHENKEEATYYHLQTMPDDLVLKWPRIELAFDKNKISSFKSSVWLDFFPPSASFKYVDRTALERQIKQTNTNIKKKAPFSGGNPFDEE